LASRFFIKEIFSLTILDISKLFLAIAFLLYGVTCVFSSAMIKEFARYNLSKLRVVVGSLEIAGGIGILVGYMVPILGFLATLGLALLMLGGVILRLRLKDNLVQIAPAAFFMVLAFWILFHSKII
jgi:hypothetical protein